MAKAAHKTEIADNSADAGTVGTESAATETAAFEGYKTADAAHEVVTSVATEGVRARRAFMLKQFIPNADWINVNVVSKGKGTRATVGRVFGMITGVTRKANILPDGKPSESIVCTGILQTESYIDGEVSECSTAYLPMAYAEKVEAVFKIDPTTKIVEIDCDIGIEATGKTIPYEWVVTAFREGAEMAILNKLKNSRARPAQLLLTPPKAI